MVDVYTSWLAVYFVLLVGSVSEENLFFCSSHARRQISERIRPHALLCMRARNAQEAVAGSIEVAADTLEE